MNLVLSLSCITLLCDNLNRMIRSSAVGPFRDDLVSFMNYIGVYDDNFRMLNRLHFRRRVIQLEQY